MANSMVKKCKHKIQKIKTFLQSPFYFIYFLSFLNVLINTESILRYTKSIKALCICEKTAAALQISFILFIIVSVMLLIARYFGRYVFKVFASFLAIIGMVHIYCVHHFNLHWHDEIFTMILGATESNITDALYPHYVAIHFAICGIVLLLIWFNTIKKPRLSKKYIIKALIAIIVSIAIYPSVLEISKIKKIREQFTPFQIFLSPRQIISMHYHACMRLHLCTWKKIEGHSETFKLKTVSKKDPVIGILVIGESLRSDKLGMHGYHRNTTQKMSKIKNLFSFRDVLSCGADTMQSVPCMLTDTPQTEYQVGNKEYKVSLLDPLNKVGFDTHWFAMQSKNGPMFHDHSFDVAKHYYSLSDILNNVPNGDDKNDIAVFHSIPKEVQGNTIYVIHTKGSHFAYHKRYTKDYVKYCPDQGLDNRVNAYDNSVVYFDAFMDKLVSRFKNDNAFILYVSDHGESLGENGVWTHGTVSIDDSPKEQRLVPMIAWMSDKFIQNNPNKFNSLKTWHKGQNNIHLTHDVIFHSFLDCLNLESKAIKKALSICNNRK